MLSYSKSWYSVQMENTTKMLWAEHVYWIEMQTVTIHDEAIRSNPFRNAVNPYSVLQQTSILFL